MMDHNKKIPQTWRIYKNVAVITIAFMVQYIAYAGAANIQSSINAIAGLGTISLAAIYTGVVISNIFLPAVTIRWLSTKWAMCLCFIVYMPYIACQMYPTFYTLVPSAFLTGLGSGTLWCAHSTYLAVSAEVYSPIFGIPAGPLLQRFLGFFFMIFQTSQIWGNLVSSLVLSSGNNASKTSVTETMIPEICGANFLASTDAAEALPPQPPEKIMLIASIFLVCIAGSTVLVAIGLDSIKRYETSRNSASSQLSGSALLVVTMKLLSEPNQLLLLAITIYVGLSQAFFGADFTASFVSCAVGTSSVGYIMMAYGLSNAVFCFITGYLVKVCGRQPLFFAAFLVQAAVLMTLLVWKPHAGDYYILLIIASLWGFCDSVWTVQITVYYGILFSGKEEAAFANFGLWEAFGSIISFALSSYVRTRYKIFLLLGNLLIGIIGYFMVEYRQCRAEKLEKNEKNLK